MTLSRRRRPVAAGCAAMYAADSEVAGAAAGVPRRKRSCGRPLFASLELKKVRAPLERSSAGRGPAAFPVKHMAWGEAAREKEGNSTSQCIQQTTIPSVVSSG